MRELKTQEDMVKLAIANRPVESDNRFYTDGIGNLIVLTGLNPYKYNGKDLHDTIVIDTFERKVYTFSHLEWDFDIKKMHNYRKSENKYSNYDKESKEMLREMFSNSLRIIRGEFFHEV